MSVHEIETAIMNLPVAEVTGLVTWLDEYYASLWDQEIEDDVNAGRFDDLLAEINAEIDEASNGSGPIVEDLSSGTRSTGRIPAQKPQHKATLMAVQNGKYALVLIAGDLLPSEEFAVSKAKEKAHEVR